MGNVVVFWQHARGMVLALLCLASLFGSRVAADEQMPAPSSSQVRQLIRQLNDAELAKRDAAEKELTGFGAPLLEILPEPAPNMPAEVQHRLERIRNQIEQAIAAAAVQPTRISITGESMALDDVLQSIRKQTGNELFDYRDQFGQPDGEEKLTLKIENEPFWQAVDRLLDQANLSIYPYAEGSRVGLIGRREGEPNRAGRAEYSRPFRIEPVHLRAVRNLRQPDGALLTIGLQVAWEPRLRPVMLRSNSENYAAFGPDEKPLPAGQEPVELELPIAPGTTTLELEVPLALPPRSLATIAKLNGQLEAIVPGKFVAFEFADLSGAKTRSERKAGAIVTIDSVRKNNDLWEVRVRLKFDDASGALASHHGWVYDNRCFLKDKAGEEIDNAAFERYAETENEVGVAYLFDIAGDLDKYSLVYVTPAAINRMTIDFSLRDLPLP
ncbi:MAG: hypothetical protein KDA42_09030 [Planctomycetales bacterium]|nr:hypothetical protein [Planctomycetales bacterium]